MSAEIHSWTDGYTVLRRVATTTRGGAATITPERSVDLWPHTSLGDVIATAAVFVDQTVRQVPDSLTDDWLRDLLETRVSVPAWQRPYANNQVFWSGLAAVAAQLDELGAPVPGARVWDRAVRQLSSPRDLSSGPARSDRPYLECPLVTTWWDMAEIQRTSLAALRGFEANQLDGAVPRVTHGDVIQLAIYWTEQSIGDSFHAVDPKVRQRWHGVLTQVTAVSRGAPLDTAYPLAAEFWRALYALTDAGAAEIATPWRHYLENVTDPAARHARRGVPADDLVPVAEDVIAKLIAPLELLQRGAEVARDLVPDLPWARRFLLYVGGGIAGLAALTLFVSPEAAKDAAA